MYPARNVQAPYCSMWPARLYNIFPHYLIKGTIFVKTLSSSHISVMELGHLLTRSSLTYPEVSSKVCHDFFCQLGNSVSLPWVIYYGSFYLHVVSSFSCIPVICLKLVLFLIPLQSVQEWVLHIYIYIYIYIYMTLVA